MLNFFSSKSNNFFNTNKSPLLNLVKDQLKELQKLNRQTVEEIEKVKDEEVETAALKDELRDTRTVAKLNLQRLDEAYEVLEDTNSKTKKEIEEFKNFMRQYKAEGERIRKGRGKSIREAAKLLRNTEVVTPPAEPTPTLPAPAPAPAVEEPKAPKPPSLPTKPTSSEEEVSTPSVPDSSVKKPRKPQKAKVRFGKKAQEAPPQEETKEVNPPKEEEKVQMAKSPADLFDGVDNPWEDEGDMWDDPTEPEATPLASPLGKLKEEKLEALEEALAEMQAASEEAVKQAEAEPESVQLAQEAQVPSTRNKNKRQNKKNGFGKRHNLK